MSYWGQMMAPVEPSEEQLLRDYLAERDGRVQPTPFADLWQRAERAQRPAGRRMGVAGLAAAVLLVLGVWGVYRQSGLDAPGVADASAALPGVSAAELSMVTRWRAPSDRISAPLLGLHAWGTPSLPVPRFGIQAPPLWSDDFLEIQTSEI